MSNNLSTVNFEILTKALFCKKLSYEISREGVNYIKPFDPSAKLLLRKC